MFAILKYSSTARREGNSSWGGATNNANKISETLATETKSIPTKAFLVMSMAEFEKAYENTMKANPMVRVTTRIHKNVKEGAEPPYTKNKHIKMFDTARKRKPTGRPSKKTE